MRQKSVERRSGKNLNRTFISNNVRPNAKFKPEPFRNHLIQFSERSKMAVRCITSKTLTAISLNQDGTCIVAATPKGIKIFSTESYEVVRDLELGPIK